MPRRNDNVKRPVASKRRREAGLRGAYRPEAGAAIARIEAKRLRLGVTIDQLAGRAGMSRQTLHNMRRDGRAWPRHLRALRFALRSIEREQPLEQGVLDESD